MNIEIIRDLVETGLSDKEIATLLNVDRKKVADRRYRYIGKRSEEELQMLAKKTFNYYNIFEDLELMSILVGTLLGDAWLTKGSINSFRGGVAHKESHLGYLEYMHKKLSKIASNILFKKTSHLFENSENQYYFQFKSSPYLKQLSELLYQNGTKVITEGLLSYFTLDSLVIWYLDDGNILRYKNKPNYYGFKIASYAIDKNSLEKVVYFIQNNFGIELSIHSNNNLYFKASTKEVFKKYLNDNFGTLSCMRYKMAK